MWVAKKTLSLAPLEEDEGQKERAGDRVWIAGKTFSLILLDNGKMGVKKGERW
jgi:hypothetical protein